MRNETTKRRTVRCEPRRGGVYSSHGRKAVERKRPTDPSSFFRPSPGGARREAGAGTLFGASILGAESDGTPDARTIYYIYPTSGDRAVIARLDYIAAAKNPARKPTRDKGIKYCVPRTHQ
jgi:hypothetical protein